VIIVKCRHAELSHTGSIGARNSKGLTNITNVGKNSNMQYSPQFSADLAQSRGLDPSVTMNAVDFGMTTQGQAAAAAQAS
jgi:hypothetical protein